MPRGDGTGPQGLGPMTGRREGYCTGNSMPGYANETYTSMYRPVYGHGGGRGHRNRFFATGLLGWQRAMFNYPNTGMFPGKTYGLPLNHTVSKKQELDMLKDEAQYLEGLLSEVKKRTQELKSDKNKDAMD